MYVLVVLFAFWICGTLIILSVPAYRWLRDRKLMERARLQVEEELRQEEGEAYLRNLRTERNIQGVWLNIRDRLRELQSNPVATHSDFLDLKLWVDAEICYHVKSHQIELLKKVRKEIQEVLNTRSFTVKR